MLSIRLSPCINGWRDLSVDVATNGFGMQSCLWKFKFFCGKCSKMLFWQGRSWSKGNGLVTLVALFAKTLSLLSIFSILVRLLMLSGELLGLFWVLILCPNNGSQYFSWCYSFLPDGEKFYTVGLAAITWAIWNARNWATFEHKMTKTAFEIVFPACTFLI